MQPTPSPTTEASGERRGARRILKLVHPSTEHVMPITLGFDLPVALLGPLPLMWRGQWPLAGLTLVATVCLPVLGQVLMATRTDRMQVRRALARGYRAVGEQPGDVSAAEWALGMSLPRLRGSGARS